MNNTNTPNYDEETIDLSRLFKAVIKRLWMIILAAVIGGLAAFSYTAFFVTPLYQAEVLLYVNNSSISVGSTKVSISASDLTAAQSLVDTYTVILKTRNTLEDLIDQYDLEYTYDELYGMISASAVNNTEILGITVTSSSPVEAEEIANAIGKILPDKIADIVEGSSVKIVDYAVVPATKSSPSISRNTMIGALAGALIVFVLVCVHEILNDEIKDEKDLTERYPYPVLGNIPNLHAKSGSKYANQGKEGK